MTKLSQNALKSLAKLRQKKHRREAGRYIAEGARLVQEALLSKCPVECLVCTGAFQENALADKIFRLANHRKIQCFETGSKDFARLAETVHSQGVLAVVHLEKTSQNTLREIASQDECLILAIEKLHDPGNLGTIFRTAAWFGVDGVALGTDCVDWTNGKVLRASMGACFNLPIFEICDFEDYLGKQKENGAVIYASTPKSGKNYVETEYAKRKILLVGDETEGLSQTSIELADQKITIPRRGSGESLNAASAAAILFAEVTRGSKG